MIRRISSTTPSRLQLLQEIEMATRELGDSSLAELITLSS
jgi:hypothetical protein